MHDPTYTREVRNHTIVHTFDLGGLAIYQTLDGADEYLTFHGTGTVAKDDLLTALRKNKREVLS